MNIAVIVGSSREMGNTEKVSSLFSKKVKAELYNLSNYEIKPFDYSFNNQDDDFPELIDKILENDIIFLASPIYWYSPSSEMKVFMDRLSDLLKINKKSGRKLRGKLAGIIATGSDKKPETCFEQVFKHTFNYLGMKYIDMLYVSFKGDNIDHNILTQEIDIFCSSNSNIFSKEELYFASTK